MPKQFSHLLLSLLLIAPSAALAFEGASAQRQAEEWLSLKVFNVTRSGDNVRAAGVVLRSYASDSRLKMGDVIYIDYVFLPPLPGEDREPLPHPLVGRGGPPLLTQGEVTYAYLRSSGQEWIYLPAAGEWTFAPPFGIWPEVRKALDMHIEGEEPAPVQPIQAQPAPEEPEPEPEPAPDPEAPQKVTLLVMSSAPVQLEITSATGEVLFKGRTDTGGLYASHGVPPFVVKASDYSALKVEQPDREQIAPEAGKDYGVFRTAQPLQSSE